jgi:hypothetical protein
MAYFLNKVASASEQGFGAAPPSVSTRPIALPMISNAQ